MQCKYPKMTYLSHRARNAKDTVPHTIGGVRKGRKLLEVKHSIIPGANLALH